MDETLAVCLLYFGPPWSHEPESLEGPHLSVASRHQLFVSDRNRVLNVILQEEKLLALPV